ncbi:MAG TPA: hypothetical protein PK188_02090 [Thermosynergistes sp.]|nr:hypothetical protein [Thermosynergistes sp.]
MGLLLFVSEGTDEGTSLASPCCAMACSDEAVPSCAESMRGSPFGWGAGFVSLGSKAFGFSVSSSFLTSFWFFPNVLEVFFAFVVVSFFALLLLISFSFPSALKACPVFDSSKAGAGPGYSSIFPASA